MTKVLESCAAQLQPWFPRRELAPLIVRPRGGPITLYQRGPEGEIFIHLNTGNTFWSQYSYQFAHEFCHVLTQYDRDPHGQDWLEESLCECASLFVLRRMSDAWKRSPPYPHWRDFAPHLAAYAQKRIEDHPLPADMTLATWYARHRVELEESSVKRTLNTVVAVRLLPFFEAEPRRWGAAGYLNTARPRMRQSLSTFFADWHRSCPPEHREAVSQLIKMFGVETNSLIKRKDSK